MPLSERVRIEIFIPDPPDVSYRVLRQEIASELSYAFGGCTEISAAGKYCSPQGRIVSDNIRILFSDAPIQFERDQVTLSQYVDWVKHAAQQSLENEDEVLISVYPVCHGD